MNDEKAKVTWIEMKSPKQGKQGRCSSIYIDKRSGAKAMSGEIRREADNIADTFGVRRNDETKNVGAILGAERRIDPRLAAAPRSAFGIEECLIAVKLSRL